MQKKAFFSLIFAILFGAFLFGSTVSLERVYDYARIETKIKPIGSNSGYIRSDIVLSGSMSSFVLAFDRDTREDGVSVTWKVDGQDYTRELDTEETDDTEALYTFPMVTSPRSQISLQIHGYSGGTLPTLIATDTASYHTLLSLHMPVLSADTAIRVISRSEWGADESIRYRDSQSVAKKIAEWEARGKTAKLVTITPAEQAALDLTSQKDTAIGKILGEYHPESFVVRSKTRYEKGHKLIIPINRAKSVDRIIVHHTAENITQASDDMTVLRAIYEYHVRTRDFGDIGYNYIIGQHGAIYEGHAGGDYVQGAHAYANNLGTVGISVMGNFEVDIPTQGQIQGLEDAIVMVARKYGIDVNEDTVGFRTCSRAGCIIDEMRVKRLHAHRNVGHTACSGKNLYTLLDTIRTRVAVRVGKVIPIYNTEKYHIDPIPEEDKIQYVVSSPVAPPLATSPTLRAENYNPITPAPSLGGKSIRIRLSYPLADTISLSLASPGLADLRIGARKILGNTTKNITVGIVGNNGLTVRVRDKVYTGANIWYAGGLIRIDSWSRIPAWDTAGRYNDNIFRSKITLRNEGGRLLVINELPVEDYLRGLGEVSNTDNTEKIKTITIAARSYARYYMERENRKYNTTLYDGSDDPDSFQKYLGYGYESRSPNVSQAVKDTLRQVIIHKNQIIKAWYHSSSDGRTLSALEYCQKNGSPNCVDIPYLQSVADPGGEGHTRSGHGVGISGIGATYWAQQGWDHKKIIQYYMNGVEIQKK